jgi:hypothetical protein
VKRGQREPMPLGSVGYLDAFERFLRTSAGSDQELAARTEMRERFDLMVDLADPDTRPRLFRRRPR